MKNFKHCGKRWLAMVLSLVMCIGLLQMPAMAAEGEGSKIVQSAFQYAQNLNQGDTCTGTITLDGDSITDSGTPEVWATGMWGGAKKVTGYNWVHITNTNPDVATASYTTDGGKLSITFTPGTKKGTTLISVGVDAKYPHDQLGTWNMELNFDYTVTNENGELDIPATPTNDTITNAAKVQVLCVDTPRHTETYTLKGNPGGWTASAPEATDSSDEPFTSAGIEWRSVLTLNNEYWVEKYDGTNGLHVLDSDRTGVVTIKAYWYNNQWTFNTQNATRTVYVEEVSVPSYTYSLTYNGNGGTVNGQASYTATSGSTTETSYSFSALAAVREGYQLKGWASTQANADAGTVDITWPVVLTSAATSKTVYAVWEKVSTAPASTECITVSKVFNGLTVDEIPEDFSIEYTAVNKKDSQYSVSKTLNLENFEDFDEDTMTLTWEAPHYYKTGGSDITLQENGDVAGYTYETSASKGDVDNDTHTVTVTYSTLISTATLTLTNTYTPSSVTPVNPKLTGFTKTRLTEVPTELGLTNINTDDPVSLKVDEEAILLYAITVTGDEGANYTVTDADTTYVGGSALSGTIGSDNEATIYVTKTITINDVVEGYVENVANLEAGVDTEIGDVAPDATDHTRADGQLVVKKDPISEEGNTVTFEVKITNKVGSTLSAVMLTDVMQGGVTMPNTEGKFDYTIKLITADGDERIPNVYSAETDGLTTVWIIDNTINPDDVIVLTYCGNLDPDAVQGAKWKNEVTGNFARAQSAAFYGVDDLGQSVYWESSGYDSCEGVIK